MSKELISRFRSDSPHATQVRRAINRLGIGTGRTRSIMITGCGEGDGRSLVTSLIGLTIAHDNPDRYVLIIDADLRNPTQHILLDQSRAPGLAELILEDTNMDEACRESKQNNLWLIPAGRKVSAPEQIFVSPNMAELLKACRNYFDFIVCDTPAFPTHDDAAVIGTHFDAAVLVIRTHKTQRDQAKKALDLLKGSGIKVAGVIANNVDVRSKSR